MLLCIFVYYKGFFFFFFFLQIHVVVIFDNLIRFNLRYLHEHEPNSCLRNKFWLLRPQFSCRNKTKCLSSLLTKTFEWFASDLLLSKALSQSKWDPVWRCHYNLSTDWKVNHFPQSATKLHLPLERVGLSGVLAEDCCYMVSSYPWWLISIISAFIALMWYGY